MPSKKKGPVFRVTGLPADQPDHELDIALRTAIDENLSHEEKSQLGFTTRIVPSCYNNLERVALVEFHDGIPGFLSDLVVDPLANWQVEMDDEDISFDQHFLGFTQLYATKPDALVTADVIAITGLDGHAYGSWRGKGNLGRMWLRDFLSKDLPCCRTMIYGYNSKLSSHGIGMIMDYGRELIEELKKVRNTDELRQRPVFFIAHSFGGIVLAHCLIKAVQTNEGDHPTIANLHRATYGMLLFGIPHKGLVVNDIQKMLAGVENHPRSALLDQIRDKSDLLSYQLDSFKNLIRNRKIISFYETRQTRQLEFNNEKQRWERTGDFVTSVDADSALLQLPDSMEEKIPLDSDHSTIVKFDNKNSRGYTSVRDKLKEFEQDASNVVMARFLPVKKGPKPSIMIPFQRDLEFVGREDIIAKLVEYDKAVVNSHNRVALVGLGGVGKSQIAIEYAYRVRESAPQTWVFWIHAANTARFEEAYKDIAGKIGIPGCENPEADILKIVNDWLCDENNGQWLMILDNADDDGPFFDQTNPLERFLAQTPNGRLLITSRNRTAATNLVGSHGHVLQVEPMDEKDALALLNTRVLLSESNHPDAKTLVQTLEFIPLAITHAAAYIRASALMTISDYLELFKQNEVHMVRFLGKEKLKDLRRDNSIRHSVIATWQISFVQIQKTDQLAANLLALMSMFDRQGIPTSLLRQGASKSDFEDILKPLVDFSLVRVEIGKESVGMHRLVQLSMRKWLETDKQSSQPPETDSPSGQYSTWAQRALEIISNAYPFGGFETRELCSKYLPHAYAVLRNDSSGSSEGKATRAHLLFNIASHLFYKGQWKEAGQHQVESLKLRIEVVGLEHPSTIWSMTALTMTFSCQGRWKEAEELGVGVVQMMKRVFGKQNPVTLWSIALLSRVYSHQGRWNEAEELGTQAFESTNKSLGEEHWQTLASIDNMTSVYANQGRWKEAEELGLQALRRRKKVFGDGHPSTLRTMTKLASIYGNQRRWKEAEELQTLTIPELNGAIGEEHYDTLAAMGDLATTYCEQGRLEEAERLNMEVLPILKKTIGEEHFLTLQITASLAVTYMGQGRLEEAVEILVRVRQTTRRTMGEEHPFALISTSILAAIYLTQKRWKEAEELAMQVLEARKRLLGAEHWDTLTSMRSLAHIWKDCGRAEDAIALLRNCTVLMQRVLVTDDPEILESEAYITEWENEANLQ